MIHRTNKDFVEDLMTFSRFGHMSELAVMMALDAFTRSVVVNPSYSKAQAESAGIHEPALAGVCGEIQERLKEHYAPRPPEACEDTEDDTW